MFFEQQMSTLEGFLKDHVTEDWSNDAENSENSFYCNFGQINASL